MPDVRTHLNAHACAICALFGQHSQTYLPTYGTGSSWLPLTKLHGFNATSLCVNMSIESTVDFCNNLLAMLATGNKGFGLHRLLVDKTAYLCRLGWHSHGSQYPRNSFGQTFEFKNSWGPSSKSADSPLILSALCHYTSWIIANLFYIQSWFLIGSICTSNDRVCKVPLETKLKPTHHLVTFSTFWNMI